MSPKGPSKYYVTLNLAIFEPPTQPFTQKYVLALPPTPPLYRRILVTYFQNTMNVKKSKDMKRKNPYHQLLWIDLLFTSLNIP